MQSSAQLKKLKVDIVYFMMGGAHAFNIDSSKKPPDYSNKKHVYADQRRQNADCNHTCYIDPPGRVTGLKSILKYNERQIHAMIIQRDFRLLFGSFAINFQFEKGIIQMIQNYAKSINTKFITNDNFVISLHADFPNFSHFSSQKAVQSDRFYYLHNIYNANRLGYGEFAIETSDTIYFQLKYKLNVSGDIKFETIELYVLFVIRSRHKLLKED